MLLCSWLQKTDNEKCFIQKLYNKSRKLPLICGTRCILVKSLKYFSVGPVVRAAENLIEAYSFLINLNSNEEMLWTKANVLLESKE